MRWFRLYDEILDDPKVGRLDVRMRWHYIEVLCIANRQRRGCYDCKNTTETSCESGSGERSPERPKERSKTPSGSHQERIRSASGAHQENISATLAWLPDVKVIAFMMRIRIHQAIRILKTLREAGLVDEARDGNGVTRWKVHGWDKRQYDCDDITKRTKKSKEKKKGNVPENVPNGVLGTFLGTFRGTPPDTEAERERIALSEIEISSRARNSRPQPEKISTQDQKPNLPLTPGRDVSDRDPSEDETGRSGEEHRLFCEAMDDLRSMKSTEALAQQLLMYADAPAIRELKSWQLCVAARAVQRPGKTSNWNYFTAVARNADFSEFTKIQNNKTKKPPLVCVKPNFSGVSPSLEPPKECAS